MQNRSENKTFVSFDGLVLEGTFLGVKRKAKGIAVLVHGGGVDRNEDGFYIRLAENLLTAGISSFRFDWRAHGKSEGRLEEMTMLGIINDIHSAVIKAQEYSKLRKVHLIGTSFGGGLSAYFTSKHSDVIKSLVLMNPLLNYKKRLLEDKPFWKNGKLTDKAIKDLNKKGYLAHGTVFRMGRPLINELYHIHPYLAMSKITVPTLTIHGTNDSMVPYRISSRYYKVNCEYKFLSIKGADHGFTMPGDEDYKHPQTIKWQNIAIEEAKNWIIKYC